MLKWPISIYRILRNAEFSMIVLASACKMAWGVSRKNTHGKGGGRTRMFLPRKVI